jgi:hypothetical protein
MWITVFIRMTIFCISLTSPSPPPKKLKYSFTDAWFFFKFFAKLLCPLMQESLRLGKRGSYFIIYRHPFFFFFFTSNLDAFWESTSKVPSTFGPPLRDIDMNLKRIWSIDIWQKYYLGFSWLLFMLVISVQTTTMDQSEKQKTKSNSMYSNCIFS